MLPIRTLFMGAAGRDCHNFNVVFRYNPAYEVVAFTAAQIPHIEGRTYPPELAGPRYPAGILIFPETVLARLISVCPFVLRAKSVAGYARSASSNASASSRSGVSKPSVNRR